MSSKTIYGCKSVKSNIDGRYHYVYRITNIVEQKHYYGKRTTDIDPYKDLGTRYLSSSTDLDFIIDQLDNPQNYKYKILKMFETAKMAVRHEATLHNMFNVAKNKIFYNKVKQTENGFDTTGMVTVRDSFGKCFAVSITDPRYLSGELKFATTTNVVVRDKDNNILAVTSEEYRNNKDLISILTGFVTVKDKDNNYLMVKVTDPRYLSGELVHMTKDTICVKDKDNNYFRVELTDPRYLSGELVHIRTDIKHSDETLEIFRKQRQGMTTVKDKDGNCFKVHKNDPRFLSGELVGVSAGTKLSDETKKKQSLSRIGKNWYTNGIVTIKVPPGTEPNGFVPGRKIKS